MPFQSNRSPIDSTPLASAPAFDELYQRTHLVVYRYLYGLHGGPAQAVEDLSAEVFSRAWKARKRFQGDQAAAMGWLLKIARNLVIDAHRRVKNRPEASDIEQHTVPARDLSPEEQAIRREQTIRVWKALRTLSDEQREIIVLRYLLEWRVKDIAAHLGKTENTISVTIRRALQRLQDNWFEFDTDRNELKDDG